MERDSLAKEHKGTFWVFKMLLYLDCSVSISVPICQNLSDSVSGAQEMFQK